MRSARNASFQKVALAFRFEIIAHHIRIGSLDVCAGLSDKSTLHVLLIDNVGQRRLCCFEVGVREMQLCLIVRGIDLCDQITLVDRLVVADHNPDDIT